MPSSFMVKRNYAHCPLKKRPLALYNEPASSTAYEQSEPEDLSVKRPKLEHRPETIVKAEKPFCPEILKVEDSAFSTSSVVYGERVPWFPKETVRCTPTSFLTENIAKPQPVSYAQSTNTLSAPSHPIPLVHQSYNVPRPYNVFSTPQHQELINEDLPASSTSSAPPSGDQSLPSLAEYYLQLFRSTSEIEKKERQAANQTVYWNTSYPLPPSPQISPATAGLSPALFPSPSSTLSQSSPASRVDSPYFPLYPESSALISPVSSVASESEDEAYGFPQPAAKVNNQLRHNCSSCSKSYSTACGLRKHKQLHCGVNGTFGSAASYSCEHCGKTYTSVGALKMHVRTHTLPCKCHVCGKAFSRPWLLQGHIRTHTGEKPFQCHECNRSFADRSNLRAHTQTHLQNKKYKCQRCQKTFSRMSLLNKHSESACAIVSDSAVIV